MPFDDETLAAARTLLDAYRRRGLRLATAESCTGGLLAALLTEIPGSSDAFDRGFVTYSNTAKCEMLGVDSRTIAVHGAVSEEVARAMADGALARSQADIAVAITGIAGPGGGSADKPVGLVWFALASKESETQARAHRFGDIGREAVRLESVSTALEMALESATASRSPATRNSR